MTGDMNGDDLITPWLYFARCTEKAYANVLIFAPDDLAVSFEAVEFNYKFKSVRHRRGVW